MPVLGITTPVEFWTDEWDKLARAWRLLNPTERDRQLQEHLNKLRDEGKLQLYPELPGWDDILKTGRVPLHLTAAEIKARRKHIQTRIQQTTTPPALQAISSVTNAIDDVQDLASFAGLVARLILRAAPRVAVRAVPVLGWIATASDVLNLLGFLTLTAGAAIGVRTEGPLGGAAAIAGPAFTKAALKRELWTMLRRNRNKPARAVALSKHLQELFKADYKVPTGISAKHAALLGKRLGFSEIIEGAQAVETLTGYGISLGAVMGFLSDAAWALYRDVSKVPDALLGALADQLARDAPAEHFLSYQDTTPEAVDWSINNGEGPTYHAWDQGWRRGDFPGVTAWRALTNYGGLAIPPGKYCYKALWIHHPAYPKSPDSVIEFIVSNNDFTSPQIQDTIARYGTGGGIVIQEPTVNGL